MNNLEQGQEIAVNSAEISNIQAYIQQKNTAVLTIMFTDIKGFTEITEQKGEQYANVFRSHHDVILTQAIEEDGAGLIIKFIGDAVMAVFSEPSVAVERALKIQQRIAKFNASQHDFVPMKVRIGLHMGQVSIANSLQTDVFGRHVNRAARIESLADGGQIYLSHAVFDSAKGWLTNHEDLVWQNHGSYQLKGIAEPIDIYEVITRDHGLPKAPIKGQKQRSSIKLIVSLVLLLLSLLLAVGLFLYQKTEIYFVNLVTENLYLDNNQVIALAGQKTDQSRKVITEIKKGKHYVYYEVTNADRYYADFVIDYGVNNIKLAFKEVRLPSLLNRLDLTESLHANKVETFSYQLYQSNGEKISFISEINLQINVKVDDQDTDLRYTQLQGTLKLNDKVYNIKPENLTYTLSSADAKRIASILIHQDEYHIYYYKVYAYKTTIEAEVYAVFKSKS